MVETAALENSWKEKRTDGKSQEQEHKKGESGGSEMSQQKKPGEGNWSKADYRDKGIEAKGAMVRRTGW